MGGTWAGPVQLSWWQLFAIARRWWPVLLGAPVVAALTALSVASLRAPVYSAEAVLSIDPSQGEGALDFGVIDAIQYQAESYERLIEREQVIAPVVQELNLPYGLAALREQVSATAVAGTQLFVVAASDGNAERAAAVANGVANRFLAYVEGLATQASGPSRAELDRQLATTRREMEETASEIERLETGSDALDAGVQARIGSLRANLEQLQGLLPELLLTAQRMDLDAAAARSRIVMAVPATIPAEADPSGAALAGVLAAVGGFVTTVGALILLEVAPGLRRPGRD
jgi:uncharacterized protein involved in exopolysaccharide biosynthesis